VNRPLYVPPLPETDTTSVAEANRAGVGIPFSVLRRGHAIVVTPTGTLDAAAVRWLKPVLIAVASAGQNVILELDGVLGLDEDGIVGLAIAAEEVEGLGHCMVLSAGSCVGVDDETLKRCAASIPVFESLVDALSSLQGRTVLH
jgi:anti-anti-sigma regulatory factor